MKNALIVGGSSGIGLATVKKLARHQFNISIIHRDRRQDTAKLQEIISKLSEEFEVSITSSNLDATNPEKISTWVTSEEANVEKFDLVLHAVSRGNLKQFFGDPGLSHQDLSLTIEAMGTNLHSWLTALEKVSLIGQGSRVVVLTSEGNKRFWKGYGAVAMAKASLETMANYLAVELAAKGMNVNIIQAGVTDTPSLRLIPGSEALMKETEERNPFGRMTTPEDVANFIYLLTLPEAKWINGGLIHVDGGEHLV